jgi:hypothetical protein
MDESPPKEELASALTNSGYDMPIHSVRAIKTLETFNMFSVFFIVII